MDGGIVSHDCALSSIAPYQQVWYGLTTIVNTAKMLATPRPRQCQLLYFPISTDSKHSSLSATILSSPPRFIEKGETIPGLNVCFWSIWRTSFHTKPLAEPAAKKPRSANVTLPLFATPRRQISQDTQTRIPLTISRCLRDTLRPHDVVRFQSRGGS